MDFIKTIELDFFIWKISFYHNIFVDFIRIVFALFLFSNIFFKSHSFSFIMARKLRNGLFYIS